MKFHFIIPVWGEHYLSVLKTILFPLLLSKNNLRALKSKPYITFCVKEEEQKQLLGEELAYIQQIAEVHFLYIDYLFDQPLVVSKFNENLLRMTACHNIALKRVNQKDVGHVFLMPDSILFDGALCNLENLIETNRDKKVFMSYGVHAELMALEKLFNKYRIKNKEYTSIQIDYATFVHAVFENLHAMSAVSFVDSKNYFSTGNMFFRVADGVVLKMNVMHPLVVFLDDDFNPIPDGLTWDNSHFIRDNIKDSSEIFYIEDTRDFFLCSVDTNLQKSIFYQNLNREFNFLENSMHCKEHIDPFFLQTSFLKEGKVFFKSNSTFSNEMAKIKYFEHKTLLIISILNECFEKTINWTTLQQMVLEEDKTQLIAFMQKLEILYRKLEIKKKSLYKKELTVLINLLKKNEWNKLLILTQLERVFNILGEGNGFISYATQLKEKIVQLKSLVKKKKKIALFGAGDDTNILLKLLSWGIADICVIFDDSIHKQGKLIQGIPVISIDSYKENLDCIVINSSLYKEKIYEQLMCKDLKVEVYK
ncbi:MAG TPA: hypothetical protein CFH79_00770 [Sulfurospirillum sp. UBA11407]|nr:MAG TPA: hypothetical protein CFH79_00770 [Sulfurospirillum sp. UBA11407]